MRITVGKSERCVCGGVTARDMVTVTVTGYKRAAPHHSEQRSRAHVINQKFKKRLLLFRGVEFFYHRAWRRHDFAWKGRRSRSERGSSGGGGGGGGTRSSNLVMVVVVVVVVAVVVVRGVVVMKACWACSISAL
jgi:hypothetical protein